MFSLGASFLPSPRGILGLREFCSFSTEYDASLYVREPKATNQHADGYVDIEESGKKVQAGGDCKGSSDETKNSTKGQTHSYERFKGRKGTLEQRLRAVVAFKRNYKTNEVSTYSKKQGPSEVDDRDLYEMMESIEEDEAYNEDDEEYLYEKYVTEFIQESKIAELKMNRNELNVQDDEKYIQNIQNFDRVKDDNECILINGTDDASNPVVPVHKPSKSGSWGLFERPADISKAYGGGRRITREEMKLMDEKYQLETMEDAKRKSYGMMKSQRKENDNEKKIRSALNKSRSYMMFGDRNKALEALEDVVLSDIVGFQSELGGEVYLEYGMVLETVDRGEESRKIYGQLGATNSSPRIKKSAMQLLQGLEITLKLRKKGFTTSKPVIDMEAMQTMSNLLSVGLTDEWSTYQRENTPKLWVYGKTGDDLYKLETIYDTYTLLIRCLSSTLFLEKVPSPIIRRAVRKMFLLNEVEKLDLMKQRMPPLHHMKKNLKDVEIKTKEKEISSISSSSKFTSSGNDIMGDEISMFAASVPLESSTGKVVGGKNSVMLSSNVFEKQLNGSWELVFSLYDKSAGQIKRVEQGEVRRRIDFSPLSVNISDVDRHEAIESFPSMWGLTTSNVVASIEWNPKRNEIHFKFDDERAVRISPTPWQDRSQPQHTLQIVWIDKEMMITNEVNKMISEPDLFVVWRRMNPTKWIKY